MLSALTLLSLQRHTCVYCEQPLTADHTYPLIEPGQLLSQTTDTGPHHASCAEDRLLDILRRSADTQIDTPFMAALWTVQASPTAPSGRILRIHDHDPDSTCLHLFTPKSISVILTTASRPFPKQREFHFISRPATYDQIRRWMEPAVGDAMHNASDEQLAELCKQIARLHAFFPSKQ